MKGKIRSNGSTGKTDLQSPLVPYGSEFSVKEALTTIGINNFHRLLFLASSLIWAAEATEVLLISVIVPELACTWDLSVTQQSLLTSSGFFGLFVFSSFWGKISDQYGRHMALTLCSSWVVLFGILCAVAPNYTWLLICRFLTGVGLAGLHNIFTYTLELLPPSSRGKYCTLINIPFAFGGAYAVVVAMIFFPMKFGYKLYFVFMIIPAALFLVVFQLLPETPRFFVVSGQKQKAMQVLECIASYGDNKLPEGTVHMNVAQQERGSFVDFFRDRQTTKLSITVFSIWFLSTLVYYGNVFLTSGVFAHHADACRAINVATEEFCHDSCVRLDSSAYLSLLFVTFADIPSAILSALVIDTIGRKPLLMGGSVIAALSICVLFICSLPGFTISASLFATRFGSGMTFAVLFIYTPEAYPTKVRALAEGSANACSKFGAFVTPLIAQIIVVYSVHLALFIFLMATVACVVLSLSLTETNGKELGAAMPTLTKPES